LLICCLHRGRHLSYQRGKRNTNPGTSLIKIEGVDDTKAAKYVLKGCTGVKDSADSSAASILERKSLSFTVRKERLEDQRSELSGERLPEHMVRSTQV
jgi:Ribosomal protein L35Ae